MRTILIASDGSPEGREAVAYGLELAAGMGAKATILEVIPPTDWTSLDRGSVVRPLTETLPWRGDDSLDDAERLAREHGVELTVEVLAGDPSDEIVAFADNQEVDLVVIGSRGRGTLARAALGSVSESVLREARRPVLVVRGTRRPAALAAGG